MKIFDPLKHFIGRKAAIAGFDSLFAGEHERWVMLVDGLSGTGKTLLIDWLRWNRCGNIRNAKLTLSHSINPSDMLCNIVDQLGRPVAQRYREAIYQLSSEEQINPVISYNPTYSMRATFGGSISYSSQSAEPVFELGSYGDMLKFERESRRLDAFLEVLDNLQVVTWVLFLDETGYLVNPDLNQFFLHALVPRIHLRFPQFRLYLSGQSVPRDDFPRHEQIYFHLKTFSRSHTGCLLSKLGIKDDNVHGSVYKVTLGHPLLLSMFAEDISERGEQFDLYDLTNIEAKLDEQKSTQWIYQRIILQLQDETLQKIAVNLSLFEWFDLSLLQKVFNESITESSFNDLVKRSFVKSLETGKWRCHDIIIKHLRPHRSQIAPVDTLEIYKKAYEAYEERIKIEEERNNAWNFTDRISFTVGLLNSAFHFSPLHARSILLTETAIAFAWYFDTEYLYSLVRYIENCSVPDNITQIVHKIKDTLQAFSFKTFGHQQLDFWEELASYVEQEGSPETAAEILTLAAMIAQMIGKLDEGLGFAQRAKALVTTAENYRLEIQLLAEKQEFEKASELLKKAKNKHGDCPILRLAQVDIHISQGRDTVATQKLLDTIATFPNAHEARVYLATQFYKENKLKFALEQVDIILTDEPSHPDAIRIRLDLLCEMGRISEAIEVTRCENLPFASLIEDSNNLLNLIADPMTRGRLLVQFLEDPDSVTVVIALVLTTSLALQGDVENTSKIIAIIQERWPELFISCQTNLAGSYMNSNKLEKAIALLRPLVDSGSGSLDSYLLLSQCFASSKRFEKERATIFRMKNRFPSASDLADFRIAQSFIREGLLGKAMHFLEPLKRQGALGPFGLTALADIFILKSENSKAIEILEQIIYTGAEAKLPVQKLFEMRANQAVLLAQLDNRVEATQIARQLLLGAEDEPSAALHAASIFWILEDEEGLRKTFKVADRLSPYIRPNILSWMALLAKKRNPSIDGLIGEFAAHPGRLELVFAIDLLITENNQLRDAQNVFDRIESIAPGTLELYINMQQETIAATGPAGVEQLRRLKRDAPNNYYIRLILARVLLAQQRFEEARTEFNDLIEIRPDWREIAIQLQVIALLSADQLELVKDLLDPYLDKFPPTPFLWETLLMYYRSIEDTEAEIRLLTSVLEKYPDFRQTAFKYILDLYIDLGRYEEGLSLLENTDIIDIKQPSIRLKYAEILRECMRVEEALEVFDSILKLENITEELRGLVLYERGITCNQGNRLDDAIHAFDEAAAHIPKNPDIYFAAAETYLKIEEWEAAYESLMNGLALKPELFREYEGLLQDIRLKLKRKKISAHTEHD